MEHPQQYARDRILDELDRWRVYAGEYERQIEAYYQYREALALALPPRVAELIQKQIDSYPYSDGLEKLELGLHVALRYVAKGEAALAAMPDGEKAHR